MTGFGIGVKMSRADPEAEALITRIERGEEYEQKAALTRLVERAETTCDPDDWNAAGIGYHLADEKMKAVEVFGALVTQFPEFDTYRLNLAAAHSQLDHVAMCRHHLRHLAEKGCDEEHRRLGRELLEGYDRFLGMTEEDDRLRALQRAALKHRLAMKAAAASDYLAIARLLLLESRVTGADLLGETIAYLEQGSAVYPSDSSLLELLVACYLHHDPNKRLDATAKRLEKLSPDSDVLSDLKRVARQPAEVGIEEERTPSDELFRLVSEGGEEESAAALAELGRLVAMNPDNTAHRLRYAFALMVAGDNQAALQQAEVLAAFDSTDHAFHFNLGQVFWVAGDSKRGRAHLELALLYARDGDERRDVYEQLADFEG